MKIAIIGAGMSGLVTLKYAKSLGLDVTCYEQTNSIGGTWVYSEKTGVHSSMYKNLKTNLPKQLMSFADFEFEAAKESYSTGEEMFKFLQSYDEKFNLSEFILFEHKVCLVSPLKDDQWAVKVMNLVTNEVIEETYDAVYICNGHYFDVRIPEIQGIGYFKGEILHSHDYRVPDEYEGKNVLIIGAGPSGTDIAQDISSKANHVFFSHHAQTPYQNYSMKVTQKPDVLEILSNGMIKFKDETSEFVDAIIYCTGYHYTFPFLTPESEIKVENNHVTPLYKHIVNINHPTMFLIGIPFITILTFMIEFQVRFALEFLMHPKKRPTKEEMLADMEKDIKVRQERGLRKKEMHFLGADQEMIPYFNSLADFCCIPRMKNVHAKIASVAMKRLKNDPLGFRAYKYFVVNDEEYTEEKLNKSN